MAIRVSDGANKVAVDVAVDVADAVASRPTLDQEVYIGTRLAMLMKAPTLRWTCTSTAVQGEDGWCFCSLVSTSTRPSSPPPSAEVLNEVKEDYLRRAILMTHS